MKKILLVLVILAALAAIAFGDRMKAGQVLVKFRVQNSGSNARVHRAVGGRVIDRFPQIGVELVQLRSGVSVSQAVTRYRRYAAVLYAGPNYYRELLFRPNDPSYSQQYHPRRVFAEEGWDLTRGDSGTVIAVLDTGQDLSHPDLHDKLLPGYDFSDNDSDPSDYQGHGTHTAGIAAADTNNGIGVAGIGFDCKIMPLKIFPEATVSNVIRAVLYATDNGANVLSMSFGGAPPSQAEEDSYTYALANDVLPIASAGNGNSSQKLYPAAYEGVLAVGSTDANDQRSDFSQFGDWVDVAAPGSDILSTTMGGSYGFNSGTSMSCPGVAGYAGLLYSYIGAGATAAEVRAAIENNCDDVGNWLAFGRINVGRGLAAVIPPVTEEFPPQTIDMFVGSGSLGDVSYVVTSDGLRFLVSSTSSVLGQVAGAGFSISMTEPLANVTKLSLEIEARGPLRGTGMVWLFNWRTNRTDYYGAFALNPTDRFHSLTLHNLGDYVSSTGEVRAVTRAHVPMRLGGFQHFTYGLNQVKLAATIRRR